MEKNSLKAICLSVFMVVFVFLSQVNAQDLRFAVISDTRIKALDKALEFIASENAEFIIVAGDYYYDGQIKYFSTFSAYGYTVNSSNEANEHGEYFAMGNHDDPPDGDPIFKSQIAPYYPSNGPALSPAGTVFSFDRGDCHFVITNHFWDYPSGGYTPEQLDWIEQDLSASAQPFKFVAGHEPAFPFNRYIGGALDADPFVRDEFWNILADNSTTAYFCGHSHNLSHTEKNGVYQIDAGEVRDNPLCVTIVDIENKTATIRSYKTSGEMPVSEKVSPDKNDLVMESVIMITDQKNLNNDIEIIYSAGPLAESGKDSGCFISRLTGSTRE